MMAKNIIECLDYVNGLDGLPKSNVLKFMLEGNCFVVIRSSGTWSKLRKKELRRILRDFCIGMDNDGKQWDGYGLYEKIV